MIRDRGETRDLRYENGKLMFPCGVKIEISEEKVKWLYDIMKLSREFETMMKVGVASIPESKAANIKDYLEKN